MLPGKQRALSGGGIILGVAILCSSCLVALSSVVYFFDGWGVFPSAVFYICLLCGAILGGFLAFYAEKNHNPKANYVFKCAIFGMSVSLLFIWGGGAAHILFVDWYVSCKSDDAQGCYSVGRLHADDLLLWSNPKSASQYFRKSCRNGSWGGCIYALESSSGALKTACNMFAHCSEIKKNSVDRLGETNAYNSVECQLYYARCFQN